MRQGVQPFSRRARDTSAGSAFDGALMPAACRSSPISISTGGEKAHRGGESAKVVLRERLWLDSRNAPMPTEYSADLFFKNGPDRGIRVRRDRGRLASRGSTLHGMTTTAISHRSA